MFPSYSRADVIKKYKAWGAPSPFMTEAWMRTVHFCRTPEGKQKFEAWIKLKYPSDFEKILEECYVGPKRMYHVRSRNNLKMFNDMACDLGISNQFAVEAAAYCSSFDSPECWPERTLPVPVRKRGETATEWRIRWEDAASQGHKIPDTQWAELRRIANSELEHIRDQMEVWRTQPRIFLDVLKERARSTILGKQERTGDENEDFHQACTDSFRSLLHIAHLQYAAWSKAVAMFEEFDRRNLHNTAAIIKVMSSDDGFLGRIVGVALWANELNRQYAGKMTQAITASDYLKPFFIRTRGQGGEATVIPNEAYISSHGVAENTLEWLFLSIYSEPSSNVQGGVLLKELFHILKHRPGEARKLTKEAYDTIGEYSMSLEFIHSLSYTLFGQALKTAALDADRRGVSGSWYPTLSAVARDKLERVPREPFFERLGVSENIVKSQSKTWRRCIWLLPLRLVLDPLFHTDDFAASYDQLWFAVDIALCKLALEIERIPGAIFEVFGLANVLTANRPIYVKNLWEEQQRTAEKAEAQERRREAAAEATTYESNIPISSAQESKAKGPDRAAAHKKKRVRHKKEQPDATPSTQGNARDAGAGGSVPKASARKKALPPKGDLDTFVEDDPDLPDALPSGWKLSRKTADVFLRFLGSETKGGQLRWADFETAMSQLGFGILHTEGSSVRFDPPAKSARPITFHRPHPDSIITPMIMKWMGARLQRTYGWTAETFAVRVDEAP